jgi:hypothetical protein
MLTILAHLQPVDELGVRLAHQSMERILGLAQAPQQVREFTKHILCFVEGVHPLVQRFAEFPVQRSNMVQEQLQGLVGRVPAQFDFIPEGQRARGGRDAQLPAVILDGIRPLLTGKAFQGLEKALQIFAGAEKQISGMVDFSAAKRSTPKGATGV